jgi:HAD superfamily hydrolase (TIGR01509 family)
VLDCDGVLADTERYGHLVAFNQMFAEFGLPVHWSVAEYQRKLHIGGGKERLASLLTPEFIAAARLSPDAAEQQAAISAWHRRKTEIYTELVATGAVPPRPGIARIVKAALTSGWQVAVASTSAETSVRATLSRAVGADQAAAVAVFAGDIVPRKKPAPDIYLLALDRLGVTADGVVVIEDSRNGLVAATAAGLTCVITVNDFTAGEDFSEAALVVSSLGDPGGEAISVLVNRSQARPGDCITLADLDRIMPRNLSPRNSGALMPVASFGDVEVVVHTIAEVAVGNEKYFGDLDAVVGDGDFGYSMARGFELVLQDWDGFDQPYRRDLWPDLGHRLPAGRRGRGCRNRASSRPDRGDASRCDRRHQGSRPLRRWRQDLARCDRAGHRHARGADRPGPRRGNHASGGR